MLELVGDFLECLKGILYDTFTVGNHDAWKHFVLVEEDLVRTGRKLEEVLVYVYLSSRGHLPSGSTPLKEKISKSAEMVKVADTKKQQEEPMLVEDVDDHNEKTADSNDPKKTSKNDSQLSGSASAPGSDILTEIEQKQAQNMAELVKCQLLMTKVIGRLVSDV